jgi:uncharacterized protein YfaP (DUF2135 family)
MHSDLRAVLTWDSPDCDINLVVTEPNDKTSEISNWIKTANGGIFSRDFAGLGPEEYLLRKASAGTYSFSAHYRDTQNRKQAGAVTVQLEIYSNFGRLSERYHTCTARLNKKGDRVSFCEIRIRP